MARIKNRVSSNSDGLFFVDSSCIDCGSCWYIDPEHFASNGSSSYVHAQPTGQQEIKKALLALIDCPVAAIGAPKSITSNLSPDLFPILVTKHSAGDVYYCGWSSKRSFGASSWLIMKSDGNVLIDSPRWSAPLARRIKKMGGIKQIVLTHRDDVADHAHWNKYFQCERWIHQNDADAAPKAEKTVKGLASLSLGINLRLVPTPGHTQGSMVAILGEQQQILFSGDHLWWNLEKQAVVASKDFCWWSWEEQLKSIKLLQDLDISWLLPGHGHAHQFTSGEWRNAIRQTLNYAVKLP
ncbi:MULTISPECIES: MBL fold metallo-hydrolase [Prochlorococcus]|uniref:MBL fold metallo-hydrolase n=1 Tax=Prochlorococcus TaxID=1218 RepID=UPI000533A996|nr:MULTISPECIES: MBL fold metallo-hydrolase [Prochlorococcus]KGG14148.1 Metallo-beta-lactamase hydrolase [Prochlorococcus sp. MIT 0601]